MYLQRIFEEWPTLIIWVNSVPMVNAPRLRSDTDNIHNLFTDTGNIHNLFTWKTNLGRMMSLKS